MQWQQFLMVAGAHFLALLSPGPDFLLIVRSALAGGWRRAGAVCCGVALANAVFIALAIGGIALLRAETPAFRWVQWAGGAYLAYLGVRLLGSRSRLDVDALGGAASGSGLLGGLLSALLNPKNALFYASLFSLLAGSATPFAVQCVYGVWMFGVVLAWDLALAALIGHPAIVARCARHLHQVERLTGGLLLMLALAVFAASVPH